MGGTHGVTTPADVLVALARALYVSADELLGLAPLSEQVNSATYRLRRSLRKVEELPADDQKTVVKLVDALVTSRGIKEGSQRRSPASQRPGPSDSTLAAAAIVSFPAVPGQWAPGTAL